LTPSGLDKKHMTTYDVIVLGTGGVGSAALFHLASRGVRVLGLDRFPPGHDRGSSHGQTRIIRQAYFEHSDYVPLLRRAYELWADLEQRRGQSLFYDVGLLEIGPPDGVVIKGVLESARLHNLEVDRLSPADVASRFPGFHIPDGCEAVFERRAGYLLVEQCVLAHLDEAQKLGAELRTGETVLGWTADTGGVTVTTNTQSYSAARLIVTAGAWASQLLSELGVSLHVLAKHLHWYANEDASYRQDSGCPTFFYEMPDGYFYGFPQFDDQGVKIAEHSGGAIVADPLSADRSVDPQDRRRVEQFLSSHLPGVSNRATHHAVCFYTMSPDEHFIVDRHPRHNQVAFAAGLSGHGFKFSTVLGEVLADLVLNGQTPLPIGFLRYDRPALR
jgi:sarcosine oxidase